MIIGIILRNFKTYKNINFIPLSNGEKFCGLIGNNGIGKSSVLEALDSFFNDHNWNQNIDSNKTGVDICYILPIFLIEKSKIVKNKEIAEKLSNAIWNITVDSTVHPIFKEYIEKFKNMITDINSNISIKSHYLLPLGINIDNELTLSIFKINSVLSNIKERESEDDDQYYDEIKKLILPLLDEVKCLYDYIYIPKDIEPNKLVQLETKEIQKLIGKNLEDVISKYLTKNQISSISSRLKSFIEDLSNKLPSYKFKAPSSNQPNLKPSKIYSLIIEEFFNVRELHKEVDYGKDLPLKQLSSGEKQQAILSLIHNIISSYRQDSSNLILAVDEPETSLHISACFDQFEKLYNVSKLCGQVLFSSHWYGFIPAMNNGIIISISRKQNIHQFLMFNISKYREEIKHNSARYFQTFHEELPLDIMLKSNNDFIQSIISSIIRIEPYNWIICEGSSEKIYFDEYFKEEIISKRLRIIPVGGAKEIKKTYNHLVASFEELSSKIKGKVILITDTDNQLLEFETNEYQNLICKRIVNDPQSKTTILVNIKSNPKTPKTEIEDVLNGKIFHKTLLDFKVKYPDILNFVNEYDIIEENPSAIALDLKPSQSTLLDRFFDLENNKCEFAEKYINNLKSKEYKEPSWIHDIKNYLDK
jgi:predicted ATPase